MKFAHLKENLRRHVQKKTAAGEISGARLAQLAGFQQAHISNFINKKRSLSLEGLDRVLAVLKLSVLDLLDPAEINRRASILPPTDGDFDNVLLVDPATAATRPRITQNHVRDLLKFKKAFLKRLRPDCDPARAKWHRFVMIKADPTEAAAMSPRTAPGASLLLDRHFTALKPYRASEPNMYAVSLHGACAIRYVEFDGAHLVLRPHNPAVPISVLPIAPGKHPHDYIVGRVCHIAIET